MEAMWESPAFDQPATVVGQPAAVVDQPAQDQPPVLDAVPEAQPVFEIALENP